MRQTNQELRAIIAEYGLTWRQAADMMMVRPTSLDRYMTPEKKERKRNPTFRALPAFRLKLLLNEIQRQQIKKLE
jgi:hypothetical protein